MSTGMMFLSCISPLHCGGISSAGWIDRPIVRERVTKFPMVPSTTMKGAFRDFAEQQGWSPSERTLVFGDADSSASQNMGFLDLSDASILAFPVRSLLGGWVLTCSETILARLHRFGSEYGLRILKLQRLIEASQKLQPGQILLTDEGADNISHHHGQKRLAFLEEYTFERMSEGADALGSVAAKLAGLIFSHRSDTTNRRWFSWRYSVLHENDFSYLVEMATETQANIAIEDTGIQKDGSLRYSEYLPCESVLMAPIGARKPFEDKGTDLKSAHKIIEKLRTLIDKKRFQLGADETTGKGAVRVTLSGNGQPDKGRENGHAK